jgi:glyoxylase-like metal-dependent hydrolase (beta-lactamase superfamily II)
MTMLFSLEALRAKHGDSLLLHYGDPNEPRLILIDGGPTGVYKDALKPRLEQLCEQAGGKLSIEILMVSHLDSDHVRGIVDFSNALAAKPPTLKGDYKVKTLWQNTFADAAAAGGGDGDPTEAEASGVPAGLKEATVASVAEGRQVRDNARLLHWPENKGFEAVVMVPDDKGVKVDLGPLKLTVVGPRKAELEELRKEWAEKTKDLKEAEPAEAGKIAAYLDESVYNLSSIVCVTEIEGKTMLLTGDARGDKILPELEAAGFLPAGGKMELDLLKVPHHGSARNLDVDFFKRLPAPHLVISANGKDGNPDLETLEMIAEARPDGDFTLYLTESKFKEEMGPKIEAFFAKERKYKVVFRPEGELSLRIDLLPPA